MKTKIKVKKFSKYGLIDVKDYHRKIYKHLTKHNIEWCFTKYGIVGKEDCKKYL